MPPPRYSLSKLKKVESQIKDILVSSNLGYTNLDNNTYSLVVESILSKLKPSTATSISADEKREVISSLLTDYIGEELSNEVLTKIARRVSGWQSHIEAGKLFKKWNMQKPVWACLKVIRIEPILFKPKKYIITFTSYSGSTVNMIWQQVFTGSFTHFLIKSIGGLRKEHYEPYDIFDLWLTAAVHYSQARFYMSHICVSSSQQASNRKLLKARKGKCIGGFSEGDCFNCPLGTDKCLLARHVNTYKKEICRSILPNSNTPHKGFIQKTGYCMHCIKIGNYKNKFKKLGEKIVEKV